MQSGYPEGLSKIHVPSDAKLDLYIAYSKYGKLNPHLVYEPFEHNEDTTVFYRALCEYLTLLASGHKGEKMITFTESSGIVFDTTFDTCESQTDTINDSYYCIDRRNSKSVRYMWFIVSYQQQIDKLNKIY